MVRLKEALVVALQMECVHFGHLLPTNNKVLFGHKNISAQKHAVY